MSAQASTSQQQQQPVASTSSPTSATPNVASYTRLYPREFLNKFLEEGVRPDSSERSGEGLGFRDVSVNLGSITTANGSSLIRIGETTIICGIKAETCEPSWERPYEGFIVPNVDLPAISSPNFKPGPPVDEAQVLSQQLYELMISTNLLPLSSLLIHPHKAAWCLYIDVTIINYDGASFEGVVLAVVGALLNTTLPKATFDPETSHTLCSPDPSLFKHLGKEMESLLGGVTFGCYDERYLLPDPTAFELPLCQSLITIIQSVPNPSYNPSTPIESEATLQSNPKTKIRLIRQTGLSGLAKRKSGDGGKSGIMVLGECLEMSEARVKEMVEVLLV